MTVMAAEAAPAIAGEATGGATVGAVGGTAASRPRQSQPRQRQQKAPRSQKISRTNYQPIILMEFVACILLTAATPIATKKDKQGLSPYVGKDIVKLSAITVLYLILAMISVGGRGPGRLAAWFGGLILLADGLYEAGNIVRDLRLVSGAGTKEPAPEAPAPGPVAPGGVLPVPGAPEPTIPLGETLPNG